MSTTRADAAAQQPQRLVGSERVGRSIDRPRSERDPLLPASSERAEPPDPRRLPWTQLSIICLGRFTEPVCFVMIFPRVERCRYVRSCRQLDPSCDPRVRHRQDARSCRSLCGRDRVGVRSGAILHGHWCAEPRCAAANVQAWGRLSDRIGRKPVIVMGLLGACASTVMFGLSRNLWTLLLSRTLQGAYCALIPCLLRRRAQRQRWSADPALGAG